MEFSINWKVIAVLIFFVTINGCANHNTNRNKIENSLLQANRRLEEALVVTHNQLVDLKRENEILKANAANDIDDDPTSPIIRRNNKRDLDNTPIVPPQVIIPDNIDSTTVPDSLKGTMNETIPTWKPHR
ncbi:MAG: hypothetical protein LBH59_00720 [Planctomycetaceae bacterium]|jgi:hypothetical protein|nr:hypothetical protein [Planctomycetaceae bacterium]